MQYRMMAYRIAVAWPSGELGMGTVYPLPDGWIPLSAVRQGETVLVLCYQQAGSSSGGATPVLASINPNSLPAGNPPTTIDLHGTGFDTSCTIYADASPRATFFLDSTHLQYTARPDLETTGSTVQVSVQGDSGTSNSLPFTFT